MLTLFFPYNESRLWPRAIELQKRTKRHHESSLMTPMTPALLKWIGSQLCDNVYKATVYRVEMPRWNKGTVIKLVYW